MRGIKYVVLLDGVETVYRQTPDNDWMHQNHNHRYSKGIRKIVVIKINHPPFPSISGFGADFNGVVEDGHFVFASLPVRKVKMSPRRDDKGRLGYKMTVGPIVRVDISAGMKLRGEGEKDV
jgi:hypothetical protein